MRIHTITITPIVAMTFLTMIGCEEDERLVEMAEKHLDRQAKQSEQIIDLQQEVTEGSRRLVEADAEARKEMIALQRDVQSERVEVGQQRDALEDERRDLASQRRLDPIIATAITNIGLLLACLLPLVLCWYLLHPRVEPADDQAVAEVLLEDLVIDKPLLLPRPEGRRAIDVHDQTDSVHVADES